MVTDVNVPIKAFSWFVYMEADGSAARAICPMLGLLVVRPSVEEAKEELFELAKDYLEVKIRLSQEKGEDLDVARPTPAEAWDAHLLRFVWQCSSEPDQQGLLWACGILQKNLSAPEWGA